MNDKLIEVFTNMAQYETSLKRPFPARAYWKAVKLFEGLDFEVDSADQIKDMDGIGSGIYEKVNLYLTTGTFPKYEEYLKSDVAKCKEFAEIKGFGMHKAVAIFNAGIKSMEELKEKAANTAVGEKLAGDVTFTTAMKIGLDYEAHTNKNRMTVVQHDEVAQPLLKKVYELPEVLECECVGSRARWDGVDTDYTIGDIDIIIRVKNDEQRANVSDALEKMLDVVLMTGFTKVSGIKNFRQVDFRIVTTGFGALKLHATGPTSFNVKCRHAAIAKGMTLNEYGLFKAGTKELISNDDREILNILGIGWVDPKDRKNF